MAKLGSNLILLQIGIAPGGLVGLILGFVLQGVLGFVADSGIFLLDLSLDAYREGKKLREFKDAATDAYAKATARVYDEAKKNEIRKQYLEIISRIGAVGK